MSSFVRFDGAVVSSEMAVLLRQARANGWRGSIDGALGGARTYAQQDSLWRRYQAGTGAPAFNPAAPDPGHQHRHMRSNVVELGGWSQAVDVSDPDGLIAAAEKLGVVLHRPYLPRETWHVEAAKAWKLGGIVKPSEKMLEARMRIGRPVGSGRLPIMNPIWTFEAAKKAGLPLALACALLEQESGGGHNVFGHDPTQAIPSAWMGSPVTKAKFLVYRRNRQLGHGMQGVGPCQLTWWAFQDRADALGGCWDPRPNMAVGFADLEAQIRKNGLRAGIAAYNGSGPAAQAYATSVLARTAGWQAHLFG